MTEIRPPVDGRPASRSRLTLVGGFLYVGGTVGYLAAAWDFPGPADTVWMLALSPLVAGAALGLLFATGSLGRLTPLALVAVALLVRLGGLALPPTLSDDVYRYAWDGRVVVAGANPYLHVPEALPPTLQAEVDPSAMLAPRLNSEGYFSVYPPPSQWLFATAAWLSGASFASFFVWYKLLLIALEVFAIGMLARSLAPGLVALYAWHPLPVLEIAGQGHTEGLFVALLLIGWAAWRTGHERAAVAAVTAAGWVKLLPLALVPFLLNRVGWRHVWVSVAVSGTLWLPFAAPDVLAGMSNSLRLYVQLFEFNAGPYLVAKHLLLALTGTDYSKTLGPVLAGVYLVGLAGLYFIDVRRGRRAAVGPAIWSFAGIALLVLGGGLLLTTTVHPWYLLMLLAVVPLVWEGSSRALRLWAWGWWWMGLTVAGTYAFYADLRVLAIAAGAVGWGVLAAFTVAALRASSTPRHALERLMRRRGRAKWRWIRASLPAPLLRQEPLCVLDLGAGEGWVGWAAHRDLDATGATPDVVLADVIDLNTTPLPHTVYNGSQLPFASGTMDLVVLVFVLHHARDPDAVLGEALRVCAPRGRVVIVESVYTHRWNLALLRFLDRWANRLRSRGAMKAQEEHLRFDTADGWRTRFGALGGRLEREDRRGRWVHRQHLFVLRRIDARNHMLAGPTG